MSTTDTSISRPVALLIGGLIGVVALYIGWVFLVQPLLGPDDSVAGAPQPTPTAVAPLPPEVPPAPPGADDTAELDSLLDLDQVESEQYQIAGARDPFRQVVIEAQVDQPTTDGTAPGTTPGTTTPGTTTPGTTTPGTTPGTTGGTTGSSGGGGTTGSTGGGSTGSGTGTGGGGSSADDDDTADDAADDDGDGADDDTAADDADGDDGEMTAGGTELAATGVDADAQAMLVLTLLLSGTALLIRTRRQG